MPPRSVTLRTTTFRPLRCRWSTHRWQQPQVSLLCTTTRRGSAFMAAASAACVSSFAAAAAADADATGPVDPVGEQAARPATRPERTRVPMYFMTAAYSLSAGSSSGQAAWGPRTSGQRRSRGARPALPVLQRGLHVRPEGHGRLAHAMGQQLLTHMPRGPGHQYSGAACALLAHKTFDGDRGGRIDDLHAREIEHEVARPITDAIQRRPHRCRRAEEERASDAIDHRVAPGGVVGGRVLFGLQ